MAKFAHFLIKRSDSTGRTGHNRSMSDPDNNPLPPGPRARTIALLYACFAGLWIVLSDSGLRSLGLPEWLLREFEVYKGLAFVAITSGLLYLLLRRDQAAPPVPALSPLALPRQIPTDSPSGQRLFALILTLVMLVPVVGFGILSLSAPVREQETYSDLHAIASLKAEQIELWRQGMLAVTASFPEMGRVARDLDQISTGEQVELSRESLQTLQSSLDVYALADILVLDTQGNEVTRLGEAGALPAQTASLLGIAAASATTLNSDLYFAANRGARMDVVRPLPLDSAGAPVSGFLVASFDLADFLFPLIHRWPGESETGETNLVRIDGTDVLFLHRSSHPENEESSELRAPLDSPDLGAAVALRSGVAGQMQGLDYLGSPVFAAWSPVGSTGWMVVAKMSVDEAMAPVTRMASWISLLMLLAVTAITVVMLQLWRQQQQAWQLSLQVSTAQRDSLMRQFYDLPFLGMAFNSPKDHRWIQFNDTLCRILGYSREELETMDWSLVTHPDDRPAEFAALERIMRGESDSYRMDKRLLHKSGAITYATLDVKAVRDDHGEVQMLVATLQDITERKQAELALRKLSRHCAALSQMNEMILRERDAAQIMAQACRIAETNGELALVWIGQPDATTGALQPLASSGKSGAYLNEIQVSIDPALATGRGPAALAFREASTAVFNAFQSDPRSSAWHAAARHWNLGSSAVCPILRNGQPWGIMAFYASEPDYFTPDLVNLLEKLAGDLGYGLETLQTQQQAAQAQAQLLLNAEALEASHEGIFITDADNRFTMVNKAFCAITGFSAAELLGQEPRMLKSGRQDPAFYTGLWESLRTQGMWQGEIWDRRKDGAVFPAWLSITRVGGQHVGIFTDITARKEYENHIQHIAHHDVLTDLPNRVLLADRVAVAIARAHREGKRVAVIFIDLDRFKLINDTLGHDIGDLLLKEVARRIVGALRASDTVSRVGGDEFVALLPDVGEAEDAARAAAKIIEAVARPFDLAGHEIVITTSAGIALYPENGTDGAELSRLADVAMMEAKQTGRNRYRFFAQELGLPAARRLELENALRGAMERGELSLAYQPQFCLRTGHLSGVEALARWTHPVLGSVPPAEFIPVAEASGLILPIGRWILGEACRQMAQWLATCPLEFPLSVNVSALQFRQPDFVSLVQETLQETGLPATHLELELTESLLMSHADAVLEKLRTLDALGVSLAIDDFGTGYSSLSYLRQFPADWLKIDQSFVADLPQSADAAAIARAIVSLGLTLGMHTIAEGVETAEQIQFLREIGCNLAQGYSLAWPLTAEAMGELLQEKRRQGELRGCAQH